MIAGLMQSTPLTLHSIFERARTVYADGLVRGSDRRLTYGDLADRVLADAAVVGVRSRRWDERPAAVIVARRDPPPTLEELRSFLASRVAKWWLPDAVVVVDEIPKTSVGKIDKKVLREQLSDVEVP